MKYAGFDPRLMDTKDCGGFPFSNDEWTPEQVRHFNDLLANQNHSGDNAVAVAIGSGSLLYILDRLSKAGVRHLATMDKELSVLDTTKERLKLMPLAQSWDDHHDWTAGTLNLDLDSLVMQHREYEMAKASGLLGDFAACQSAAALVTLTGVEGNIIKTMPEFGRRLVCLGRLVTALNFTNVEHYLGHPDMPAGDALAGLAGYLPISADAVIVEEDREVRFVQTAPEYFERHGWSFPPQHSPLAANAAPTAA